PLERAQLAVQLGPLADHVARHAGFGRRALDQRTKASKSRSIARSKISLDRLDGLDDVRVGVEDAVPGARHETPRQFPRTMRAASPVSRTMCKPVLARSARYTNPRSSASTLLVW